MAIPGAVQLLTGGPASRACSSVSNRTIEKPRPSAGSNHYPAMRPGIERTIDIVNE
jgi:hypothetical protein